MESSLLMRTVVKGELFREAVSRAVNVVDRKKARPILAFFLFEVRDGWVSITASNLEVSARVKVKAQIEGNASFCVNPKNLSDILRELPDGDVELVLKEGKNILELNCNSIHFSLLIQSADEYPQLSFENKESYFEIASNGLLEMIEKTSHAISDDDTRSYLNGIYMQEIESKLRVVATDGHRLALLDTAVDGVASLSNGIIVPKKGVSELKRIAESFPGEAIGISMDEAFMYVSSGESYYLSIRLIASDYPKYQAVIPDKTSFTMRADKNTLLDAIRRIKIMSSEKSNGVKISFRNSELILTSQNHSLGEADEKIPVEYIGKEMEMAFNAKYLIDSFSTLGDGEVSMEMNNELSAVVIKANQSPNYLGVIMPLRL